MDILPVTHLQMGPLTTTQHWKRWSVCQLFRNPLFVLGCAVALYIVYACCTPDLRAKWMARFGVQPQADPKPLSKEDKKVLAKFVDAIPVFKEEGPSYVWVHQSCRLTKGTVEQGWIKQKELSALCGFNNEMQTNWRENHPAYLFATPFSNVHTSMPMPEPVSSYPSIFGMTEMCSEGYFHGYKLMLSLASKTEGERQALIEEHNLALRFKAPEGALIANALEDLRLDEKQQSVWREIREDVMTWSLYVKFAQNPLLKAMLIATDPWPLVQLKGDWDWGSGQYGQGKNGLGKCLEKVRGLLKNGGDINEITPKLVKWKEANKKRLGVFEFLWIWILPKFVYH